MKYFKLRKYKMPDGTLFPLEFTKPEECPFEPKRAFWIKDVPENEMRANHAHRKCEQFLTVVSGSCIIEAYNGVEDSVFQVIVPGMAYYAPALTWLKITGFTQNCILLVFASEPYDVEDYIDSYEEFKKLATNPL